MSYHRFATETIVSAFDVREGDVTHSSPVSCCGGLARVLSVVGMEDHQGGAVEVSIGCDCGERMRATLREQHVLSYSGTLALL